MVVQDRQFNPDGSLLYPVAPASTDGPWIGEYFDDLMLVNGFVAANGGPNGVPGLDDRGREAGLRSALESAPAIPWFQAATAIAQGEYVDAVDVVTRIGAASVEAYSRLRAAEQLSG